MNISIFGLGYVGCVGMGCLAAKGHTIVGVDVSEQKVELVNTGRPTIVEEGIAELIASGREAGRIRATHDYRDAVRSTDVSFLCVGTPSSPSGHLNLEYLLQTAREIGEALREKSSFHIVVIRSTVFPGTNERISQIIEQESGRRRGDDFAVVSNPEFLREGTAVRDFNNPPLTVLGSESPRAISILTELYSDNGSPIEVVPIKVAEMIKYVNNSYHALKVTFANEVGSICKQLGVDSHELMRLFCMDRQLNISPYYFKPGFAYGGSCLPKDLRGLKTLSEDLEVDTPVLHAIEPSNNSHIQSVIDYVAGLGKKSVTVLGISFKAGTDDMRNSPIVTVINALRSRGMRVRIYDSNVSLSFLTGRNKTLIEQCLPELETMLCSSLDEAVLLGDVIIVANKSDEFAHIAPRPGTPVVDLVRINPLESLPDYHGLCW